MIPRPWRRKPRPTYNPAVPVGIPRRPFAIFVGPPHATTSRPALCATRPATPVAIGQL
jgi:hypothetical protein